VTTTEDPRKMYLHYKHYDQDRIGVKDILSSLPKYPGKFWYCTVRQVDARFDTGSMHRVIETYFKRGKVDGSDNNS
jgi:hypothetical protein